MRANWIPSDVVAAAPAEQVAAVENFFSAAGEEDRLRAVVAVFTGVELSKNEKESPPNPLQAARQITRVKNALDVLCSEAGSLSPDSWDALRHASMERAVHSDLNYWRVANEMSADPFLDQIQDMAILCTAALQHLPTVDREGNVGRGRPKGTIAHHDRVLASATIEAFTIVHKRRPKLCSNDKTEVDPIYACIGRTPNHGLLRQMIENITDIKLNG